MTDKDCDDFTEWEHKTVKPVLDLVRDVLQQRLPDCLFVCVVYRSSYGGAFVAHYCCEDHLRAMLDAVIDSDAPETEVPDIPSMN